MEGFLESFDGTRLFYEREGAGPTVVLCDGIACDGFIWKYVRPALRAKYEVVHMHWRGHGRSGPPRDRARVGIADHARDLHAVLEGLGVTRACLVAHSMGTQVALEAWRQRPDRVAGLVLACGSYGLITRTFHGTDLLSRALPEALAFARQRPGLVRALWSRGPARLSVWFARQMGEVDALRMRSEDLVPYFEHAAHLDPEMFLAMLSAAGTHTAEDLLPDLRCPTLVVAAGRDTFTPVRYAEQMARQIPGAEMLSIPDGSHAAFLEQHELVNARLLEFLAARVYPPAGD